MDKEEAICDLFNQCSHQQQLSLLKKLSLFLKRDFITLLPPEIVAMILSYVEPVHVIKSYMLVRIDLATSRSITMISISYLRNYLIVYW